MSLRRRVGCWLAGVLISLGGIGVAGGQQPGAAPVYPDDAPVAGESLERARELAESGNQSEAVRVLQRLLNGSGHRVLALEENPDLFITVRAHVHRRLLRDPDLLAWYRRVEGPRARRALERGEASAVERDHLLTEAGFEAALRLAERRIHDGAFEAARLMLEQLEDHPDREGDRAAEAARLARRLARYLDRREVVAWSRRWAEGAGLGEDGFGGPVAWPEGVGEPGYSPLTGVGSLDVGEVVATPLHSRELIPTRERHLVEGRGGRAPGRASRGWVLPTVAGDMVFVNDGARVGAWDRFTLQPIWRTRPAREIALPPDVSEIGPGMRAGGVVPGSVSVGPSLVVALTGRPVREEGREPVLIHALDRASGRTRWTWHPSVHDPELAGGMIEEPALLSGETVVVFVTKRGRARRLWSEHAFGLDAWDGTVRWSRLVASAGTLPYSNDEQHGSGSALVEGVVYRVSASGLIASIEAATGRVRWVHRREGPSPVRRGREAPGGAWMSSPPIVDGSSVIVAMPGGHEVVRLDRGTGRLRGQRDGSELGVPRYLLRVGDRLVTVGEQGVVTAPLDEFETGRLEAAALGEGPAVGRAVASRGSILLPVRGGLMVVDAADPSPRTTRRIELEHSGQVVPVAGQLLVADEASLHSYLVWDGAERVLLERMAQRPSDPEPALTFLELAHQAGRHDRLVFAADQALEALEAEGRGDESASRARLFKLLARILGRGRREHALELTTERTEALLERLERAARTPPDRLTHLLVLGALRERDEPAEAIGAYQRILASAELLAATWEGSGFPISGRAEATRRVRDLVGRAGAALYESYARAAAERARMLGDAAAGEAYASLAQQYPVAPLAPELWLEAAVAFESAGRPQRAIRALRAGLEASSSLPMGARRDALRDVRAELGGRLALALARDERIAELAGVLERFSGDDARPRLTRDGRPIERARLEERIETWRSARRRLARIGPELAEPVRAFDGWRLERAMLPVGPIYPGYALATRSVGPGVEELASLGPSAAGAEGGRSAVEIRWRAEVRGRARVLRATERWVDVLALGEGGGRIVRLDARTGARAWRTDSIATLLHGSINAARRARAGRRAIVRASPDGRISAGDVLVASEAGVLVVADRVGRVAAVDLGTGQRMWSSPSAVGRVHDLALAHGVVTLGGATEWDASRELEETVIASLDARTGEMVRVIRSDSVGAVRWLRSSERGLVVAGFDSGIMGIDPIEGGAAWRVMDEALRFSLDAWIAGGLVVVLDADRRVRVGSASDGAGLVDRVVPGEVLSGASVLRAEWVEREGEREGGGWVVISGRGGLTILDESGRVVGADAIRPSGGIVPPVLGAGHAVTIETEPTGPGEGGRRVFVLDETGRLIAEPVELVFSEGDADPSRIALVDGVVLVTAGATTYAIPAPRGGR